VNGSTVIGLLVSQWFVGSW